MNVCKLCNPNMKGASISARDFTHISVDVQYITVLSFVSINPSIWPFAFCKPYKTLQSLQYSFGPEHDFAEKFWRGLDPFSTPLGKEEIPVLIRPFTTQPSRSAACQQETFFNALKSQHSRSNHVAFQVNHRLSTSRESDWRECNLKWPQSSSFAVTISNLSWIFIFHGGKAFQQKQPQSL